MSLDHGNGMSVLLSCRMQYQYPEQDAWLYTIPLTHLWCEEDVLVVVLVHGKLQQGLGGHAAVDGIHEHVKLVHAPEG